MDRKDFLKKSILGTGAVAATALTAGAIASDKEETKSINGQVGFNHIPPTAGEKKGNFIIHRSNTRGHANHGWLDSHHTFSFANYYNPERMSFGVLRVLNDDMIAGGTGFNTHPHNNMEIISIPLEGSLKHKDSMGNETIIKAGEIQVMSAGTGVEHSEFNGSQKDPGKFLQIWVFPNKKNVTPRYDQIVLSEKENQLNQILSPNPDDAGVWIYQNAWFDLGNLKKDTKIEHALRSPNTNGVYAFVIDGEVNINGQLLERRDGMGITGIEVLSIQASSNSRLLLMEVPLV